MRSASSTGHRHRAGMRISVDAFVQQPQSLEREGGGLGLGLRCEQIDRARRDGSRRERSQTAGVN